ncbi:hypothetical protein KDL45_12935 [bacterium]|nr:hypothetical protein [bacterium]
MTRIQVSIALLALMLPLTLAVGASANDFEHSARFLGLADTGNAVYNTPYNEPVFENIAALAESPKYFIGGDARSIITSGYGAETNTDYTLLGVTSGGSVKSASRLNKEDDPKSWANRVALLVQPGFEADYQRITTNEDTTALELVDTRLEVSPVFRLGVAYGFHDIFSMGLGLTFTPTTLFRNSITGTQDTPSGNENKDVEESWFINGPIVVQPEIGFLFRTNNGHQFGLNYEVGMKATTKTDVTHTQPEDDIDYETEAAVIKPHNIGVGWAYEIPKVDRFFVAMDVDVYFRDTFEGDTIDPRSGRDYYVYNSEATKDEPEPFEGPYDPNETGFGEKFYASTNNRFVVSAAVEKAWETIAVRGGMGYSHENGLDRDRPKSVFYMTAGPSVYFDDVIFLAAGGRFEIGFQRAETTYGLAGGGASITMGGSF